MNIRVGIAAAVLAAGGATAVAVVAAQGSGASPQAAAQSGFSHQYRQVSMWTRLGSAVNSWRSSHTNSYNMLTGMTVQSYNQTTQHGQTFAEQRGIVVLATNKFLVLQSASGALHLWLLNGKTVVQDVSATSLGTQAMTGNWGATQQAMTTGNMTPATSLMAGSWQHAMMMQNPVAQAQTVTVVVPNTNLTVTVTIQQNTATVTQTATMPQNTWSNPIRHWMRWQQNPWTTTGGGAMLARGDLALVVGFRSHGLLHANLVLFSPLTTGGTMPTPTPTPTTVMPTPTPTVTVMPTATPTAAASSSVGSSGSHY